MGNLMHHIHWKQIASEEIGKKGYFLSVSLCLRALYFLVLSLPLLSLCFLCVLKWSKECKVLNQT